MSGILYLIATPIGNLGDMSQRAIEVLRAVDLIAAEDTRHSRKLLEHYSIKTPLQTLHAHNEASKSGQLLSFLQQGQSIALISDAGTPLVSDPGLPLVQLAQDEGVTVSPIPGACAAIAALSVSGLPTARFAFEGFLPAKSTARSKRLAELVRETRTLIFYEAPHRLAVMLKDMVGAFGPEREGVIARELTKRFETVVRAPLSELIQLIERDPNQSKGEFVLLVSGCEEESREADVIESEKVLQVLLAELPVKQAASLAAKITGGNKNSLYARALELKSES